MPAPGTIELIHPSGALTLKRARLPELLEEHDVSTFRAPFGTTWHKAGTGNPRPASMTIRGVLEGATPTETDDLLDELHAILPTVTHVWVGDWMIPVHGGGGRLVAAPTLRGWSVELQVAMSTDALWALPPYRIDFSTDFAPEWIPLL